MCRSLATAGLPNEILRQHTSESVSIRQRRMKLVTWGPGTKMNLAIQRVSGRRFLFFLQTSVACSVLYIKTNLFGSRAKIFPSILWRRECSGRRGCLLRTWVCVATRTYEKWLKTENEMLDGEPRKQRRRRPGNWQRNQSRMLQLTSWGRKGRMPSWGRRPRLGGEREGEREGSGSVVFLRNFVACLIFSRNVEHGDTKPRIHVYFLYETSESNLPVRGPTSRILPRRWNALPDVVT